MAQKQPTILDLAQRAGVSKSLVSLVMRGSSQVSDARRRAVLEAAEELGYRPNAMARGLAEQRTAIIGCVISDLHNPFFAEVFDGIEEVARREEYRTLLATGFLDPYREEAAVATLVELRVDALVTVGPVADVDALLQAGESTPLVAVGYHGTSDHVDTVSNDDYTGFQTILDHLVDLGHSDIATIYSTSAAGGTGRHQAYLDRMRHHGLEDYIAEFEGDFTRTGGRRAMESILANRNLPTGVVVANDFAAVGALDAIEEAGYSAPDDISVTGYDDVEVAGSQRINLTTIRQDREDLGRIAATSIIERLRGERERTIHKLLPNELVVRGTTGPPRG